MCVCVWWSPEALCARPAFLHLILWSFIQALWFNTPNKTELLMFFLLCVCMCVSVYLLSLFPQIPGEKA